MSLTILYFLHAQHRVQISQRLPIDTPNHLLYFLHVQRHVHIIQGLSIDIPYQYFILFTHVASRKKSKGLPINTPYNFYYFQHAHRRVQKARGSRSTLYISSTTFSTCIATYKK
jgi:hypothetical protein